MFFSVGDDSGDLHASNLMRAIRALDSDVSFVGLGMRRMLAAGLEPLAEEDARGSALALHYVWRIGQFRRRFELCRRLFRERRPDLVVLVDFGGFNLYLARAATAAGIPVLYYILPQVWAHGRYRLKKIRKWVTRALVVYPFEPALYRSYGVEAQYVGHPLFDELEQAPPSEDKVNELRASLGQQVVGLFPGSRRQEVQTNLPVMLKSAARIRQELPQVRFATVCPEKVRPLVRGILQGGGPEVALPGVRPVELARASVLCVAKPGTITLEIASQLTPMIVFYRLSGVLYFLLQGILQTPYLSIVNKLADRVICPEKLMWKPEPNWVAGRALKLLADREQYERCRRDLRALMEGFARPGASGRAARVAVDMARGRSESDVHG